MTPDPWSAVGLSVVVGAASTVATLPVAVATAWVLARKRFFGRSVLSALVLTPLVLPPVVTGLLLLTLLGRASPVGRWLEAVGWPVPFSLTGATIAAAVVGFPL